MKLKALGFLLISCLLAANVLAQTHKRLPIYISATTSDDVGKSFVYELRQEIARSPLYLLADDDDSGVLHLNIVSLSETGSDANNYSSAVSLVLTLKLSSGCDAGASLFLDNWVINVGSERTESMAKRVMASIDDDIEAIRNLSSK